MYKVVRVKGGRLRSCIVEERNTAVTYVPGKEARAPKNLAEKGYHLLVFVDLKSAKSFVECDGQHHKGIEKIWKVKVKGVIKRLPKCLYVLYDGKLDVSITRWPKGTVMAKVVILTEEVR